MCKIPKDVADNEEIVRTIFHPLYINRRNELMSVAFMSPVRIDEVSVDRLNYCSMDFCKKKAIEKMHNPGKDRNYYGFAISTAAKVRSVSERADVVASPTKRNKAHANIKLGVIIEEAEEISAEHMLLLEDLTNKFTLLPDPNPTSEIWEKESQDK